MSLAIPYGASSVSGYTWIFLRIQYAITTKSSPQIHFAFSLVPGNSRPIAEEKEAYITHGSEITISGLKPRAARMWP